MKISKLFHWLYAFVMFLPILALGSSILISTFNMNAKEEAEITYKYKSNEVQYPTDLVVGNIYAFNFRGFESQDVITAGSIVIRPLTNIILISPYLNEILVESSVELPCSNIQLFQYNIFVNMDTSSVEYTDVTFGNNFIAEVLSNSNNLAINASAFDITDYNEILSVETHNLNFKEVFYDTLDCMKVSPYFSWAYNSFLVTPLAYIVGLFSMPTNHVVVMLLSYWLAISIIWLVFDLIMYVPLIVHRWLDKGVLE